MACAFEEGKKGMSGVNRALQMASWGISCHFSECLVDFIICILQRRNGGLGEGPGPGCRAHKYRAGLRTPAHLVQGDRHVWP